MARLRGTMGETSGQETDPYVMLLVAVVEQAWRDLELPVRQQGRRTEFLPTQEEQAEAWLFLKMMMDSSWRTSDPEVDAPPLRVGLDACRSERLARQQHLVWREQVQEAWALLSAHQD